MPTIIMEPSNPPGAAGGPDPSIKGAYTVTFQDFTEGQQIDVSFYEINDNLSANDHGQETLLGTVSGTIAKYADGLSGPVFTLTPTSSPQQATGDNNVKFTFPAMQGSAPSFTFNINPSENAAKNEGEYWEIEARVTNPAVISPTFNVARVMRALPVRTADPKATYDWHAGHDLTLYHDGSVDKDGTSGAFFDITQAISQAKSFIFIADWSFHPYMRLSHADPASVSQTIGQILIDKARANPDLLIAIHTWDHTNLFAADDENDNGNHLLDDMAGGTRPSNLLWRASSRTGFGWSHHQKFVVLDCPATSIGANAGNGASAGNGANTDNGATAGRSEIKAFYGGLDLTKGRFDTPDHPIGQVDPTSQTVISDSSTEPLLATIAGKEYHLLWSDSDQNYDDWYNAEFEGPKPLGDRSLPREPWHDHYAQITGPSAWDVVREFVGRWNKDAAFGITWGDNSAAAIKTVADKFKSLWEKNGDVYKFVLPFEPRAGNWTAQLYRSIVKDHWGSDSSVQSPMKPNGEFQWTIKNPKYERSIQDAYIQSIRLAERFIYIENQYFIGSGSHWDRSTVANTVPEEIVNRIIDRINNNKPFHAYIVMPMFPEGDPTSGAGPAQRIFEFKTIEYMVKTVQASCGSAGASWTDYLSFYFLAQWTDKRDQNGMSNVTFSGDRKKQLQANGRYMIYVHSKLMIVDDRYVILGSANLNERSLAGDRDTEICFGVWPSNNRVAPACVQQIQQYRQGIWQEHFGSGLAQLVPAWQTPETAGNQARTAALGNYYRMRACVRYSDSESPDDGHICAWPLILDANSNLQIDTTGAYTGQDSLYIPDGIVGKSAWQWIPTSAGIVGLGGLPIAE